METSTVRASKRLAWAQLDEKIVSGMALCHKSAVRARCCLYVAVCIHRAASGELQSARLDRRLLDFAGVATLCNEVPH